MEKLQVATVKRKSKDDFDVPSRSNKQVGSTSLIQGQQTVTVVKQLKDMFNTDMNEMKQILPC
jgi:hypothetical protein